MDFGVSLTIADTIGSRNLCELRSNGERLIHIGNILEGQYAPSREYRLQISTSCGPDVSGHPHPAQNRDHFVQRTQDTDNQLHVNGCEPYTFGGLHTASVTSLGSKRSTDSDKLQVPKQGRSSTEFREQFKRFA